MRKRHEAHFRAFGVGYAKTGTRSLARMFARHYRAKHEPSAERLLSLVLNRPSMTDAAFCDAVGDTLAPLDLEMNSSQINGYIVDAMVKLFPDGKFILTIRDPQGWISSLANHQRTRRAGKADTNWLPFRDLRFRPGGAPTNGKQLYSIEEYLTYWVAHNVAVMRTVPPEQLLIVSTERLDPEIPRLASFLGIAEDTIVPARANEGIYTADGPGYFDKTALTAAAGKYAAQLFDETGFDVYAMRSS